jgi:Fe-S-cluster containining protein
MQTGRVPGGIVSLVTSSLSRIADRAAAGVRLRLARDDVAGAARVAYRLADDAQTRATVATAGPPPACTAGCTFCCHVHVDATHPELLAIAVYVEEQLGPSQRAALREKLAAAVERSDPLSDEERWAARIPCALLDEDGRCSVYPVRPLRCRAFHSVSRNDCRAAFDGTSETPPTVNPTIVRAVELVELGYTRALEREGRNASPVRLERGLLELLDAR